MKKVLRKSAAARELCAIQRHKHADTTTWIQTENGRFTVRNVLSLMPSRADTVRYLQVNSNTD